MREIKFRAWDKFNHKMYEVSYIGLKDSNLIVLVRTEEGMRTHRKHYPSACELMEYTGLEDDNGIEIYEGDIIKMRWNIFNDYDNENYDVEKEGVVKFKHGYWMIETEEDNFAIDFGESLLVLGNIFEED